MDTSILIAKFAGPVMLAASVSLLVNRDLVADVMDDVLESPALLYFAGVLALIAGLAIVNAHNIWTADWRVLITIIGWMAIIGGVMRMVFPKLVMEMGTQIVASRALVVVVAILNLLFGAFLTYMAYLA